MGNLNAQNETPFYRPKEYWQVAFTAFIAVLSIVVVLTVLMPVIYIGWLALWLILYIPMLFIGAGFSAGKNASIRDRGIVLGLHAGFNTAVLVVFLLYGGSY